MASLFPNIGPELILKQGILRRSVGESVIQEKKDVRQNVRLNGGDFSLMAPLLLFQIQEYTPSSMAPGANLIFFNKSLNGE